MSEEKVIIVYNGLKTILLVSMNETMEDVLKKYGMKIQKDINELYFRYDGNEINKEKKYKEIINNIDKKEMIILAYNINNYIIGEIEINEDNINEDIRIINTFEEIKRQYKRGDKEDDYKYENEKEIKDNCEIKINNNIIPFNYFYKFTQKGKYIIQYSFKKYLTKINHMFYDCSSLSNLNLSNFNTQNVINMWGMFIFIKFRFI